MQANNHQKRAIVMGGTSGIGYETAMLLLRKGWTVGIAGRRKELLEQIRSQAPERIFTKSIDITQPDAPEKLMQLITEMGGIELYLHSSGIGFQNPSLNEETELRTLATNGTGFTRMVTAAYHYFSKRPEGHIAVISSIAGTRGLGIAPAYSATKRFQNTYIDALEQLAHIKGHSIRFTDIRPGFVATELLNNGKHYPLMMRPEYVARHIVNAIERKQRIATIDWRYRIIVALWRLIPPFLWKRMKVKN